MGECDREPTSKEPTLAHLRSNNEDLKEERSSEDQSTHSQKLQEVSAGVLAAHKIVSCEQVT